MSSNFPNLLGPVSTLNYLWKGGKLTTDGALTNEINSKENLTLYNEAKPEVVRE